MLGMIGNKEKGTPQYSLVSSSFIEQSSRNEAEDMQTAIALVYKLKEELQKLHPICEYVINHLLQQRTP